MKIESNRKNFGFDDVTYFWMDAGKEFRQHKLQRWYIFKCQKSSSKKPDLGLKVC